MDSIRHFDGLVIDQRVPYNYHPSAGGSGSTGATIPDSADIADSADSIIKSIDFFLATTERHGSKRKHTVDENVFNHKTTKRQCPVFESRVGHVIKRKDPISNGNVYGARKRRHLQEYDEPAGVNREPTYNQITIKLTDGIASTPHPVAKAGSHTGNGSGDMGADELALDLLDSSDFRSDFAYCLSEDDNPVYEGDIYLHSHCNCGNPAKVIEPMKHKMPRAEPMRKQLLKRLTAVVRGSGNVCCPRYCCFGWRRVSASEVYCQYR